MSSTKPKKINNSEARSYVQNRKAFIAHNIQADDVVLGMSHHYTVYSYGAHFPLFVYADGIWFENEDKYSETTSKHRTVCHPLPDGGTYKLNTAQMMYLDDHGIHAFITKYKFGVTA